jgi:hypothetical protein
MKGWYIMSRILVLVVFMAAWLATGIAAGIVMGRRRHDHFPWWLLGVAFGALMVPLVLGTERRDDVTDSASSYSASHDQPVPAIVGIDDFGEAAAVLTSTLDRHKEEAQRP